jgi:hypothetical protein
MHTSTELRSDSFSIELDGRRATITELLAGTDGGAGDGAHGRLGIVVREPCGAVGASLLLLATITAFYDAQRARAAQFYIYPDYFLFHIDRPHGDHSMLDVWPSHKEVVVPDDPDAILEAINDRAITWLAVPERAPAPGQGEASVSERAPAAAPGEGEASVPERAPAAAPGQREASVPDRAAAAAPGQREALASACDRIVAAFGYSATGRVPHGDVRITGNEVTESYARAVLDPEGVLATRGDATDPYAAEVARRAGEVAPEARAQLRAQRDRLRENGRPLESYRRLTLDRALASLAPTAAVDSSGQNR